MCKIYMQSYIFYSLLFIGLIIEMLSYQLLKHKENPRYFAIGVLCFVFRSNSLSFWSKHVEL